MPKLAQYEFLLDVVCFLYPSRATAEAGTDAGGTGFLVSIPSETYPNHYHHTYVVTNRHVACGAPDENLSPNPVVRINRIDGKPEAFDFDAAEWQFIHKQHDIAVVPIDLYRNTHKAEAITVSKFFVTPERIKKWDINAAEDVFMLGRFIDYDGKEANLPAMRFGNISMMEVDVPPPNGCSGRSYVVDMHSRTGFSGSPVFVYRTAGSIFAAKDTIMGGGHFVRLLGILWGQFPEEFDIKDKGKPLLGPSQITLRGMSGMSLVAPAAAIKEVLDLPRLKAQREAIDKTLHKKLGSAPVPQAKRNNDDGEGNPKHAEDFTRLLNEAAKKREPED